MSSALIPNSVILLCTCRMTSLKVCVCVCFELTSFKSEIVYLWRQGSCPCKQLLLIGSPFLLELVQDWLSLLWHHQRVGAGHDVMDVVIQLCHHGHGDTLDQPHVLSITCNVHHHRGNVFNTLHNKHNSGGFVAFTNGMVNSNELTVA